VSINSVTISGRVTRDAELRTTASGNAILGFSVAVNDRINEGGEWKDRPNYIDCKLFGKRAESMERYLTKGTQVFVAGKLRQGTWTDKTGAKRNTIEVIVEDIDTARGGESQTEGGYIAGSGAYRAPQAEPETAYEDIPF